jgi:hypothetical protein
VTHLRTAIYLIAAAVVWFAEDGLFSIALRFNALQTTIASVYFVTLLATAVWLVVRAYRRTSTDSAAAKQLLRMATFAPMAVVIVGSFLALVIFMTILIVSAAL